MACDVERGVVSSPLLSGSCGKQTYACIFVLLSDFYMKLSDLCTIPMRTSVNFASLTYLNERKKTVKSQ